MLTPLFDYKKSNPENPDLMANNLNALIDLINREDTKINSFISSTIDPDFLDDQIEDLFNKKESIKKENQPLFGLTLGIKDIFNVNGLASCCGSLLPSTVFEGPQSTAVTRLMQAGAIALGKTVSTEFAFSDPGPTANPHNLEHTPGGSSSGSCAAVAAGFCDLALGTQTIGSVIRPAAFCGIYGIKPTYGRISALGVLPFSKSADHIGVFSLSIKIIQKAMEAAAEDWCSLMPVKDPGLIRAIIIPCGPYLDHADQDMKTELDIAARKLENKGFTIKRINCFDNFEHIETMHRQLIAREFYETHQSRLKRYGHLFRKGTLSLINQGLNISEYDYEKALQTRFEFAFECANILYDNQAIMFMTPSSVSRAPKGFESTGDPIMNLPWTYSGMPAFNVPVNMDKCRKNPGTLPAGLQFTAPRGMDEELLSYMNLISDIIG